MNSEQAEIARMMEKSLNEGQQKLVNSVMNAINRNEGGVFCVEAHGGKLIFYVFWAWSALHSHQNYIMWKIRLVLYFT